MLWVIVSVLLILLLLMIVWYSYRTAFYSPAKRKEDCYAIPNGEQYQKSGLECCRSSGRWMKSLMNL